MNISIRALAAAAVATLGVLAVLPGAVQAAAPAPHCESGASRFFCSAASVGTTTWTVTFVFPPESTVTFVTPGPTLSTSCPNPRRTVRVFYRFVSNGVTQTSGSSSFICNPGPWP
ncbi:MAG TPA: hypothetical protein VFC19_24210 [Candidatus Limnocylindrales bacterium]|nr:hypothetical protein [Candidatus Limnocylindrales bacterium]